MQDGTYVGEDEDGEPVTLELSAMDECFSGALSMGGRELPVSLMLVDGDLVGAVHEPGEGRSYLVRASSFCGLLHLDLLGNVLRLRREGE
jgi:hypothetical protein